MLVQGKLIAERLMGDLKRQFAKLKRPARLGILSVAPDFATQKFLTVKKNRAADLGVTVLEQALPEGATTESIIAAITDLAGKTDGVVVQLPLPSSIDTDAVLAAIPGSHDVDGLGKDARVLPPVVGAIKEILANESVIIFGKKTVIVGKGRLVGAPASAWLSDQGAEVVVLEKGDNVAAAVADADMVLLGAGQPGLLTADMIKEGAMVLDAGTSEQDGKLVGDADPKVEDKARFLSPTPGGIGPVAVAMIFHNLLQLVKGASK
jgi:methylenetetrahydrofolate dehydrogenase (NADP+) / methenyltetrahydrofolate cyclohydrolase